LAFSFCKKWLKAKEILLKAKAGRVAASSEKKIYANREFTFLQSTFFKLLKRKWPLLF